MTRSRRSLWFFGIILLATAIASPSALADHRLTPRSPHEKASRTTITAGQSRDAAHVKFVQGSSVRLTNGRPTAGGKSLPGLDAVFRAFPVQNMAHLFSQPVADIEAQKSALERATGEEMPDLNLWYRVKVTPGTDMGAFIDALNALPEVEVAYPAPLPAPPPSSGAATGQSLLPTPVGPPTPSFVSSQGYLKAAPSGIDAEYAWTRAGGKGANVTIVDVEYGFNATHEDLKSVTLVGGQYWNYYGNDHGTAVLGELIGVNNSYGVTGIAYDAAVKFSSPCMDSECSTYNPADAVNTARANTTAGDVILLEQQNYVCGHSGQDDTGFGPIEWYPDVFDSIKTATSAGRIVVEAAGNGSVNLDEKACNNQFNRALRDSGAIIVGAGAPPDYTQKDRSRLDFSSYGSRLDLQGWGRKVVTTGYGDLYQGTGPNQWYTDTFAGTSSASPIVAGAAALLSSMARHYGVTLTPSWVRSTLVATGSPQQASPGYPASQKIGPRPNLKAAITRLPAPAISISPVALNFGPVKKGVTSASRTITIRNTGYPHTQLAVEKITLTGVDSQDFAYDAANCTKPLAQGKSCTISVAATPSSYGLRAALVTVFSNDPKRTTGVTVSLAAHAVPPKMTVSPLSLNFGTVTRNKAVSRKITVGNAGLSDMAITSVTLSGSATFTQTNNCGALAQNKTCTVTVTFTPVSAGAQNGSVNIVPDYGRSAKVSLVGRGR